MRYLLILFISGCSVTTSTTVPDWVSRYWSLAQEDLIRDYCYPESTINRITPLEFKWEYYPDVFKCGGKKANGCFNTSRTISINLKTKQVVRHEAKHAILYAIGHRPEWKKIEHEEDFRGMCK